jgi:mannose-1-phosphate guanylyltransferase/phosphomannomutase
MAGGEGTRLRPLTARQPKPMLAMANRPMAEHIIELLRRHGIDEIVLTVAFLANTVRTYFGDGSEFGVHIDYAVEESPLGTAGSVRNAARLLGDEPFLVISGDVLTDIDLSSLVAFHQSAGATATLALKAMENPLEFGIVITDESGRIDRFLEKPSWGEVFSDTINTGIYVLHPEVVEAIPEGRPSDFSSEVFPDLLEAGKPLYGFVAESYWEDVGTLDAYLRAHHDILAGEVAVTLDGFLLRPGVRIGEGVEIDPSATVAGPALLGDNCRIGPGATVGEYTVLGAGTTIRENAHVEHSVIHDNVYLGANVDARGCVIGRSTDLRGGVHVSQGVVIGDGCHIGAGAVLHSGVRIYPSKTVEAGATVSSSIIWESRGARSIFGPLGVSGLANVDLSPEVALRAAMAFGSMLPKGSVVTTSRDSSRAARALKRAAMAGLNAAGISVADLEVATIPVTRFAVKAGPSRGGITIRLVTGEPQEVVLRFLDAGGGDLAQDDRRKVERLFDREESRRVLASEIGDIDFPPRTIELYTAELISSIDLPSLRERRWKLVLDYGFGTASLVMPNVLAKLGAEVLAVNPHVSTVGVIGFDRHRHAARVAELVRSSGADLGAVIGADGEQLTLIDDEGHVLSDAQALLGFVELVASKDPGGGIAVPVDVTGQVEALAAAHGSKVLRTRLAVADLMEATTAPGVGFGGDASGGFIFARFLPAFDAVASLVHLLGLLGETKTRLSGVIRGLPEVHIAHREVTTPFEQKGAVMRSLLERSEQTDTPSLSDEGSLQRETLEESGEVSLLDGLKRGTATRWTLVVPDGSTPTTHVTAEASSDEEAEALASRLAEIVAEIVAAGTDHALPAV